MRHALSIRWWLSVAFALIAAVTVVAVTQVVSVRSEEAFRDRAQALAAGNAFEAAIEVARADSAGRVAGVLPRVAEEQQIALFVYDRSGRLVTPALSRNVRVEAIRLKGEALASALGGRRFVETNREIRGTTVALPLTGESGGVLLAFAYHPDLAAGLGIVRREIVVAALWAVLLGGAVGFLLASLITIRLRRIAGAAAAIERGDLGMPLRAGFADEVGSLAGTVERMRQRLRASFGQLASERDRVERLVERLRDGVVSVRGDLTVELANAEARRLLGAPRLREGESLPDPWPIFALDVFVSSLFSPRAEARETLVAIGDERTIAIVGLPPHDGSETAILVLSEVSERERHERAEREFVANAAHELRTPLTTIVGAVEALQAGAKDSPGEQARFLAHIEREAGRLTRLTRALLVLARAQTRQEAPGSAVLAARELLDGVRRGMSAAEGVVVDVECSPELLVRTDPDLVEQALANLAANAARYTTSGRIVLGARRVNGGRFQLEVADTGPGVAPSEQERVFERFYRSDGRDAEGFGLGLSIVRQAVVALGGTIDFRSAPGSGTRVRIELPDG